MLHTFQALGTTWWIEIFDQKTDEDLTIAIRDSEVFVAEFEQRYSRFITASLISIINRDRALPNPDTHLRELLAYGKQLSLRTDGHFNILTGHILEARGYNKDYTFAATDDTRPPGDPITDLTITPNHVSLAHGNLDIGGYGKGYLIDEVAKRLQEVHSLSHFLINAGGDMYATSDHGTPIQVGLEHPRSPGTVIKQTSLLHQGFAASSPYKRQWEHEGTTYSHVVSDTPSVIASFIKAPSARDADAFATTCLLTDSATMQKLVATETEIFLAVFDPTTNNLSFDLRFFSND